MPATPSRQGRVVLAGAHGHGRWHLRNVQRLAGTGAAVLVGVCDTRPLDADLRALAGDVPVLPGLEDLVRRTSPDVTIVCTPIHTHVDLTLAAMRAGSHVLLEKPPAATLDGFGRLLDGVRGLGRACQVGFQDLGSAALDRVDRLVAGGAVGDVLGVGGACAWVRDASYYGRSAWAGRRVVDGTPVVDGALTNPFAHAVASALRLAGAGGAGSVASVEVELYRANAPEADDTSCVRVRTRSGVPVVVAATLAAEVPHEPVLTVHGTAGTLTLAYKSGRVRLRSASRDEGTADPRTDLLENLLAHVADPSVRLLVPPEATASFMDVLEAVRRAPDPLPVPAQHLRSEGSGPTARKVVVGIDDVVEAASQRLLLFSELGVPWAAPATSYDLVAGAGPWR